MAYIDITPSYLIVSPSGFDSRNRYIRRQSGGSFAFSGGRTMRTNGAVKVYASTSVNFAWVPFKVDLGSLVITQESITHSSVTDTSSVPAVSPSLETCTF